MLRNAWLTTPITAQQAAFVKTMVGNILNNMPNLLNLTADDKSSCLKVGIAQLGMMEQTHRIFTLHPNVLPRYHDPAEFNTSMDSVRNLLEIHAALSSLLEAMDGTLTAVKSDAMRMCLVYYQSLKQAQKSSLPGLRRQFMEIRDNFIHETGQTPEEQFPALTGEQNTPADNNGGAPA